MATDVHRPGRGLQQPAQHRLAFGYGREVDQDGDKLVAAQSRQRIADAQGVLEAFRNGDQQIVAGLVTVAVVDRLEAIEIKIDQSHEDIPAPGLGDGLPQPIGQQHAIRQSGQGVEMGHVFELALMLLHRRDVGEQADVMLRAARGVAHVADGEQFGVKLAVLAAIPELSRPAAIVNDGAPHRGEELRSLQVRFQHPRIAAKRFVAAVAGDVGKRVIDVDDVAGGIGDQDTLAGMGEYAGRQLQTNFGALACGDVDETAAHLATFAFGHVVNPHLDDQFLAGRVAHDALDQDRLAAQGAGAHTPHAFLRRQAVGLDGCVEVLDAVAQQLFPRATEQLFRLAIDVDDAPRVDIEHRDRVGRVLDQTAEAPLALRQAILRRAFHAH